MHRMERQKTLDSNNGVFCDTTTTDGAKNNHPEIMNSQVTQSSVVSTLYNLVDEEDVRQIIKNQKDM